MIFPKQAAENKCLIGKYILRKYVGYKGKLKITNLKINIMAQEKQNKKVKMKNELEMTNKLMKRMIPLSFPVA